MSYDFMKGFLNKLNSIGLECALSNNEIVVNTIPYCKICSRDISNSSFNILFKYNEDNERNYHIIDKINGFRNGIHWINTVFYQNNTEYINDIIFDDLIRYLLHYKNVKMFSDISKKHSLIFNDLEFNIRKIKLEEIEKICN